MRLTRELDLRFEKLQSTGTLLRWYSQVGHEATTVPAGLALVPGDSLCTLHRDLGAVLAVMVDPARTFPGLGFGEPDGRRPDPEGLLYRLCCQLLGRRDGFSHGVERSFHYGYFEPAEGICQVGMISHLGSMIPVAAGCAFAHKQAGTGGVAINFIGDGGTSTGDFHEGLNMASVWKLPLVLVIENNHYAFSTPTDEQYAVERLSSRGAGYGMAAETVDGNDPDAMADALAAAVGRARAGQGPTLIEADLGRMRGHAVGDGSVEVIPKEDLERWVAADPLPAYERRLATAGLLGDDLRQAIGERASALVEAAVAAALDASGPDPRIATRPVFAAAGTPPAYPLGSFAVGGEAAAPAAETGGPLETTYIDAINRALTEEMARDGSVLVMGQDVGAFGGAFKATRGLYDRWPERVLDTPISESGTLGIAIGAALLGYRTVVEMQFADFVSCGFNQLVNVAAKLFYRWQAPCPIVVRLPSGGGSGVGPYHSQNPEGWFAHVAGLKVVCPATPADAHALLVAAIRDPNPVIFCEHRYLYRRRKEALPPDAGPQPLGEARVRRPGDRLSLIGYGATLWTCLEAAEELAAGGVEAEVVDLRTLVPLDVDTVAASVRKTGRALIVHEAQTTAGFGAEVAARLAEVAFPWLDAPIRRVGHADRPSPYAKVLEAELLPTREKVLAAARELLEY